jgi:methanogenic corrinoid protein MtbC1
MVHRRENDTPEANLAEFGRAYAAALLAGDEIAAELVVRDALDAGLGMPAIDDEIIAPALWLVGDLWERGDISIADEHLATEISLRVLALARETRRVSQERPEHRVMRAAPTAELHVVALRMSGDLLRDAGYDVVMLGADVPPPALAVSATRHKPDVICMSSTMPGGGDQVLVSMHEVQRAWPKAGFALGGRGLTSRLRALPGVEVCERVTDAVEAVDALVKRAASN